MGTCHREGFKECGWITGVSGNGGCSPTIRYVDRFKVSIVIFDGSAVSLKNYPITESCRGFNRLEALPVETQDSGNVLGHHRPVRRVIDMPGKEAIIGYTMIRVIESWKTWYPAVSM